MDGVKDFFGGLMGKVGGWFQDLFKDGVGPGLKKIAPWVGGLLGSSLLGGVFDWVGKNLLGDFPGSGIVSKLLAGVAGYFLTDWIVGSVFDDKKPAATAAAPAATPTATAAATPLATGTAAPVKTASAAPSMKDVSEVETARFASVTTVLTSAMKPGEVPKARLTPANDTGAPALLPKAA